MKNCRNLAMNQKVRMGLEEEDILQREKKREPITCISFRLEMKISLHI